MEFGEEEVVGGNFKAVASWDLLGSLRHQPLTHRKKMLQPVTMRRSALCEAKSFGRKSMCDVHRAQDMNVPKAVRDERVFAKMRKEAQ